GASLGMWGSLSIQEKSGAELCTGCGNGLRVSLFY
ncbi:hypothetical protein DBR06_SOUSAS17110016, partial [Sousa chinensis]